MINYGRNGMWTRLTTDVIAALRQRLAMVEASVQPLEALVAEREQLQAVITDLEHALGAVLSSPEMLADIGSAIKRKRSSLDGRWSRDHDACVACGQTERRHHSHGRCVNCTQRDRARTVHAVGVA